MYRKILICALAVFVLVSCQKTAAFLSFESVSCEIEAGKSEKLTIVSSGIEETSVVWESSDVSVAEVNDEGVVSGIAVGEAIIKASSGQYEAKCRVRVLPHKVESVSIEPSSLTMNVSDESSLSFEILPEDSEYESLEWSSSDMGVVTVDKRGKLKAIAEGKAVITLDVDGVKAECEVTVENEARIGSFYYSDGTFSAGLNPDKEVIGIIFWVGNPGKDDPFMKKDFPECVNGLVVSVHDVEGTCQWQESSGEYASTVSEWVLENTEYETLISGRGVSDRVNKIVGYNNTMAMKAFNGDSANSSWTIPSIASLDEFSSEHKAPEGTSGWYLPSAKELSLLCTGEFDGSIFDIATVMIDNLKIVNESLSLVEGAEKILSSTYWSSSEYDKDTGNTVFMGSGVVVNGRKENVSKVRYVLAF